MSLHRRCIAPLLLAALLALLGARPSPAAAELARRTANDGQLILEDIPPIPADIAAGLQRYRATRSARFRGWTEDGEGLYITTRFAEVSQLHRVDRPGGARHQLTFLDEPIGGVAARRGGRTLALSMDTGGSEFDQIFLFDPADASLLMLTDGSSRNGGMLWSPDGGALAYTSTRRNGRANDLWLMDPALPEGARTILESPDGSYWGAVDFSADGGMLLVQQYVSAADSRAHLLDLGSGERRRIAGDADAPSVNGALALLPDASGAYLATDRYGEFRQLVFHPLDGGREVLVTEGLPWDLSGFALADDGSRGAFTLNENGISSLHLLDPESQRTVRVKGLPRGIVYGLDFGPEGRRLALTLATARNPADVFVLELGPGALEAGALTRWTFSEVGGLDTEAFVEPELLTYPSFDEVDGAPRQIPAFVYRPAGAGPFPVIVSIHGGPESQYRPGFSSTFQYWVRELGAAVIAPNVRGSAGYGKSYLGLDNGRLREDSVRDIGALLDWIATRPELDADRVAVFGGSYGGYMVLASAVHYSDRLRAAVDVVGISSFVTFLENTEDYRRDLRRVEYGDERDPEMRAFLERISPLNNVEKIAVPMLVVQGQNDPRVPVTEAEQIVAALRARGQPVWYMNALNEGHGYARKENRDLYLQAVALFFRRFLLAGG